MLTEEEYYAESRSPFCTFLVVGLLLGIYELGVGWSGGYIWSRGGLDGNFRWWLQARGLSQYLPPFLILGFLGWSARRSQARQLHWQTVGGMVLESLLFSLVLILIGQGVSGIAECCSLSGVRHRCLIYLGAGIYEELVFRQFLLAGLLFLLSHPTLPDWLSRNSALLCSAAVFALSHHNQNEFQLVFRGVGGIFFGLLFLLRGLGIAIGTHVSYDILVGVVLVSSRTEFR